MFGFVPDACRLDDINLIHLQYNDRLKGHKSTSYSLCYLRTEALRLLGRHLCGGKKVLWALGSILLCTFRGDSTLFFARAAPDEM